MPRTTLVFASHPDDAEFYAGGVIARFVREGDRAVIVIVSDGRRGSFTYSSEKLAPIRAEEARRSAMTLGAEPPILLSHPDMDLDQLPPGRLREQFIRLIRQHRPDRIIAPDPWAPHEPHPDHRAVAWAVSDALHYAHLPLVHPEHLAMGLEAHFVTEKYYYGEFPRQTIWHAWNAKTGLETAGYCHVIVDISDTIDTKMAALAEHQSQMAFLVEDVLRQAALLGPTGPDIKKIMHEAAGDPVTAMTWFIKAQAADIGKRTGVSFGEAFRYERFHPIIESILSTPSKGR